MSKVDKLYNYIIDINEEEFKLEEKRIEKVTNKYNLEYILFARKPNIKGLLAAKKMMGIENNENIAVIRRPSIYRCTSEGTMQE